MSIACSIYGLGVDVNVPIAALAGLPSPARIDLRWSLGSMPRCIDAIDPNAWQRHRVSPAPASHEDPDVQISSSPEHRYLRLEYPDHTVFVVDALGQEVWATWPESSTVDDVATYLLGSIMGLVLRLRGITCLHASAVAIDGRAVALVGASGSGKSSTAAAFAQMGFPVLADDVVALVADRGNYWVQPAYPRVRLWRESVESLFGSADALPLMAPGWEKRYLPLGSESLRFPHQPLELASIYVLDEREPELQFPRLECVNPSAAMIVLVAHSFATNFLDRSLRSAEFDFLAGVVERVPVVRVTPSSEIARIRQLCAAIAEDAGRFTALRANG